MRSSASAAGSRSSGITADDANDAEPRAESTGYLANGTLVDGKYPIERVLGEGGMGVVYLARDIHTETSVVVKSIRAEFADAPEFRARTLAEGRALARIDHPNVVRLNAVVVEPAALYLVMQFIDGEPLDKMIERHVAARRPSRSSEALSIFRMILQGVGAAHAEGLIHRDLKPANVLIRKKDGVAKVTDFGIAKGEEDAKAGRGVTKGIIGSLSYMAPEQVRGAARPRQAHRRLRARHRALRVAHGARPLRRAERLRDHAHARRAAGSQRDGAAPRRPTLHRRCRPESVRQRLRCSVRQHRRFSRPPSAAGSLSSPDDRSSARGPDRHRTVGHSTCCFPSPFASPPFHSPPPRLPRLT